MKLTALPPVVEFHQITTVLKVTAFTIAPNRTAVLIHVPGGKFDSGRYLYLPYCDTHKTTWDSRDFLACPMCQANEIIPGEIA